MVQVDKESTLPYQIHTYGMKGSHIYCTGKSRSTSLLVLDIVENTKYICITYIKIMQDTICFNNGQLRKDM